MRATVMTMAVLGLMLVVASCGKKGDPKSPAEVTAQQQEAEDGKKAE